MSKNTVQFNFRMSAEEYDTLCRHAKKTGYTQSRYLRSLISGYVPKEKADERFYEAMQHITTLCDGVCRIARRAELSGIVEAVEYRELAQEMLEFKLEMKRVLLLPDRVG